MVAVEQSEVEGLNSPTGRQEAALELVDPRFEALAPFQQTAPLDTGLAGALAKRMASGEQTPRDVVDRLLAIHGTSSSPADVIVLAHLAQVVTDPAMRSDVITGAARVAAAAVDHQGNIIKGRQKMGRQRGSAYAEFDAGAYGRQINLPALQALARFAPPTEPQPTQGRLRAVSVGRVK